MPSLFVRRPFEESQLGAEKFPQAASYLSFTEPAGLFPSNLQSTVFEGFGFNRCSLTSGVWPTYSSTVGY